MPPTHVTLTVTTSGSGSQTTYRLASPTGRTLILNADDLRHTLFAASSLLGHAGKVTLPIATVRALSKLGSVEEPPATPQEER